MVHRMGCGAKPMIEFWRFGEYEGTDGTGVLNIFCVLGEALGPRFLR